MKYFTSCKETGDFIEEVKSLEEAKRKIEEYEEEDKKEGCYEPDFYGIVNEYHETIEVI